MILFLIWSVVLVALLILFVKRTYSRFSEYGVKHEKIVPFIGNIMSVIIRKNDYGEHLERIYKKFPEERFIGVYELVRPTLIITDLDLIKKIAVKDFEHFVDHRNFLDDKVESLFARTLFTLKGEEWKDMRSTLSPAFTSSKIKLMVPFMEEVGEQMIKVLENKIKDSDNGFIDIDVKDLTSRYTNDVIASCAFGLKVNSHTDENNNFYEMGKLASTFKFSQMLRFFLLSAFPALAKKLKVTLFSNKVNDFFIQLVTGTMKDREIKHIIRPDMIHLLMEVKKGQLAHEEKSENDKQDTGFATVEESAIGKKTTNRAWSDVDLTAQALLFFIAGFETISTAMSFALHELAVHPDVQDRLVKEIKEVNVKNGGKLNFNDIQNMTYLDMVISEVLRLWPPFLALDRMCVKDYNMGKANSKATKDFIIKKGEAIGIPAWCFHRDSQFFSDPLKFDPERFSDENKHKINPMTYMPFGLGARNCIGSRFALCELKSFLCQILLHVEVSPSHKTCIPARLSTDSFSPRMRGGHWLRFKIRN